jgi:hypothetical protein
MRRFWGFGLTVATSLLATGCGPAVPDRQLGSVVYEVPEVPGAKDPYQLPAAKPAEEHKHDAPKVAPLTPPAKPLP